MYFVINSPDNDDDDDDKEDEVSKRSLGGVYFYLRTVLTFYSRTNVLHLVFP